MKTSRNSRVLRKSKIDELVKFDNEHGNFVIGTDEAGRGPVAGPVVASAVFFPEINDKVIERIKFIDDSKKFSSNPSLRKELSEEIKQISLYSIAECSVEEIEKYNILRASLIAMQRACNELLLKISNKPAKDLVILVDGRFVVPDLKISQVAVKKGDTLSASIAAASILAKVYRDQLMEKLSEKYDIYDWHKNKGYPTPAHIEAIRKFGACEIHRQSFLGKIFVEQKKLNK